MAQLDEKLVTDTLNCYINMLEGFRPELVSRLRAVYIHTEDKHLIDEVEFFNQCVQSHGKLHNLCSKVFVHGQYNVEKNIKAYLRKLYQEDLDRDVHPTNKVTLHDVCEIAC